MGDDLTNPCNNKYDKESMGSILSNLTEELFGEIVKTISGGTAVWDTPCNASQVLDEYPRQEGEGIICYFLRILPQVRISYKGEYSALTEYILGDLVLNPDDSTIYYAVQGSTGESLADDTYWTVFLPAIEGPTGPTGGANATFSRKKVTANYTTTENDQVIEFENTSGASRTITLIEIPNLVEHSKWYRIKLSRNSNAKIDINAGSGDTVEGGGSIELTEPGESVLIVEDTVSNWEKY